MKTHVFIVGSKGIPAQYGGFETFVENLTKRKVSEEIQYHVSCMNQEEKHFTYNGADCFNVRLPLKGAPGRILHVSRVLSQVERWKKEHPQEKTIVYILGCRIGPLLIPHAKKLHALGAKIYCNPDGLEWKRDKWNVIAKKFLRYCEACLVKKADLVICDSLHIEEYIRNTYPQVKGRTTYIAYGADVKESSLKDNDTVLLEWQKKFGVKPYKYYLIVGRFVPDNNYKIMLTEFMESDTVRDLVIISNVEKNKFYQQLRKETGFDKDNRIKFVGTVYDQELLKKIREQAFAYIHGHEVGGTNPSLLEALASTRLNLLLDVGFNREVAQEGAIYWSKKESSLTNQIMTTEVLEADKIRKLDQKSRSLIEENFSWSDICRAYEELFI